MQLIKFPKKQSGFALVEVVVALFIFSLVVTIALGSVLSLLDSSKKTQSLKTVMNNLNIALDTMTKTIAVGKNYHCGSAESSGVPIDQPFDCGLGGDNQITFLSNYDLDGDGTLNDHVTYELVDTGGSRYLARSINSATPVRMTSQDIDITSLKFYVTGTATFQNATGDKIQPEVFIVVQGTTRVNSRNTQTAFNIQTLVSQRVPDF